MRFDTNEAPFENPICQALTKPVLAFRREGELPPEVVSGWRVIAVSLQGSQRLCVPLEGGRGYIGMARFLPVERGMNRQGEWKNLTKEEMKMNPMNKLLMRLLTVTPGLATFLRALPAFPDEDGKDEKHETGMVSLQGSDRPHQDGGRVPHGGQMMRHQPFSWIPIAFFVGSALLLGSLPAAEPASLDDEVAKWRGRLIQAGQLIIACHEEQEHSRDEDVCRTLQEVNAGWEAEWKASPLSQLSPEERVRLFFPHFFPDDAIRAEMR